MNDIDRSIEFCASLDPEFPARIRGADRAALERLQELMGRPPGTLHSTFLERMGSDIGGLQLGWFEPTAVALLAAHEGIGGTPPEGVELFAVCVEQNDEDMLLVGGVNGETAVMLYPTLYGQTWERLNPENYRFTASTLPELLCVTALRTMRMHYRPVRQGWYQEQEDPAALGVFAEIMEAYGFATQWFSTRTAHAVVRDTIDMIAVKRPGQPFSVEIAGSDGRAIADISERLRSALNLVPYEITPAHRH